MSTPVERVYAAQSLEDQQAIYDDWAQSYEPDLCAMGYRIPAHMAAVVLRHVDPGVGPILDAGCGGGIQAEALPAMGYGPFTGIDLSEGMLAVARAKGIYATLRQQTLGAQLDFDTDAFGAVISSGVITPGHAPAHSFDELVRVCRPGGRIVFSLRSDSGQDPAYFDAIARLTSGGLWREIFSTPAFQTMPYGEPEIFNRIHVYEVT